MLSEIKNPYQNEPGVIKREFYDEYFDLYIWYYSWNKRLKGFQLCYDKQENERVLTWTKEDGFYHKGIDGGIHLAGHFDSPILIADGVAPIKDIITRFKKSSEGLDPKLASFIKTKLDEYNQENKRYSD